MYTPKAQMECNKDMMERQVNDCINGLFAARKNIMINNIMINNTIPESSRDDLMMLLHEAADLLAIRYKRPSA